MPSSGATSPTGSAADDYGSPSGDILDSGSFESGTAQASLVLSNSPFDSPLEPSPRAAEAGSDSYGIPVVDAFKDDILGLYMYVIIYSEINGHY